jgi:FAD/FMN-containing dehydrogenase
MTIESWGRNPKVHTNKRVKPLWRNTIYDDALHDYHNVNSTTVLPYGLGRSYGDCCLNDCSDLIHTRGLNKIISFDTENGILRAESGISLAEILDVIVKDGWFLPVTPGTKYVTLGGAIANDIHGKNQTKEGTFGRYVTAFELLRSDGQTLLCKPTENADYYRATIAGLGLTGLITWAEIQLKKVSGPYIDKETLPFVGLDKFFQLSEESEKDFLYTVAWIDGLAKGSSFGRGIFFRGNHSNKSASALISRSKREKLSVPFSFPNISLNHLTVKLFNEAYFRGNSFKKGISESHYDPFFYPLDSVGAWNKVYGSRGFFQFQNVVPSDNKHVAIEAILRTIVDSKQLTFLGVIKCFGDIPSPGMLSFPRKGITLALDFPNKGAGTWHLLRKLHEQTVESGGAIYPAKDAWMTSEEFVKFYPQFDEFKKFVDPKFNSSLYRRIKD